MRQATRFFIGTFCLFASACQTQSPATISMAPRLEDAPTAVLQGGPNTQQIPQPSDDATAASKKGLGYITQIAIVRRQPVDAKEVEIVEGKKRVANWIATLSRGEQITVLESQRDWFHVRTSDEKTGWLKSDNVVLASNVTMATVANAVRIFSRPDLLAFNGTKVIEPGTLLFALRTKDQFSEVNLAGNTTGWVLTDVLMTAPREVDAAKLLHRARFLKARNDPAADGLLELAKTHFSDTHLVQTLLLPPPPEATQAPSEQPIDSVSPAYGNPPEAQPTDPVSAPHAPNAPVAPGNTPQDGSQQDPQMNIYVVPNLPVGGIDHAPSAPGAAYR